MPATISRRTFTGTLGAAAGAALLDSALVPRNAEAAASIIRAVASCGGGHLRPRTPRW
jgi:hypothetical protein